MDEDLIEHVSNDAELMLQCQLFHYNIEKFTPRKLAIAAINAVNSYRDITTTWTGADVKIERNGKWLGVRLVKNSDGSYVSIDNHDMPSREAFDEVAMRIKFFDEMLDALQNYSPDKANNLVEKIELKLSTNYYPAKDSDNGA